MRVTQLLTAAAAGLIAVAAAAQDVPPAAPASAPVEAAPPAGLSGLETTVGALRDERATPAPTSQVPPPAPAAVTPAPAAVTPAPAQGLTPGQAAALNEVVQRGRLLTALARAGQIATQDMLVRIADPGAAGIKGWIAEPEGNGAAVTFYADGAAGPVIVYRGIVLGGRSVSRNLHLSGERPALNRLQARMAAARAATDGLDHQSCGTLPFNVLVIPPASADAPVDIYQISAQPARGRFPLGGHFRSTIAPDGTVASARALTGACLALEAGAVPAGQQPPAIRAEHALDPTPNEVHVFLALWSGRPLIVAAGEPRGLWAVTGERITPIRP